MSKVRESRSNRKAKNGPPGGVEAVRLAAVEWMEETVAYELRRRAEIQAAIEREQLRLQEIERRRVQKQSNRELLRAQRRIAANSKPKPDHFRRGCLSSKPSDVRGPSRTAFRQQIVDGKSVLVAIF